VFLGGHRAQVGDTKDAPDPETFLQELAPILLNGWFFPISNQVLAHLDIDNAQPCSYCNMASACRRFEAGAASRHAALVEKFLNPRLVSIAQAAVTQRRSRRKTER
jgi:hypothetical protein